MADLAVSLEMEGMEEIMMKLNAVPDAVRNEINDDLSEYLVNTLRQYPSPKYVTRKRAYGKTFFSDKQRKWFFAALSSGEIDVPYKRTQHLANMWQATVGNKGELLVVNDARYATYVMGEAGQQSRHEKLVGWKSVSKVVKDKSSALMKRVVRAANKALQKIGQRRIEF